MRRLPLQRSHSVIILLTVATFTSACSSSPRSSERSDNHSTDNQNGTLVSRYLAIATAGNRRLEIDFDGLSRDDRTHLGASLGDVRDAASTEGQFDQRLLVIDFPKSIEAIATTLYSVNEFRASITEQAGTAQSLQQLREYESLMTTVNGPVEEQVRRIRCVLGLPPPSTS